MTYEERITLARAVDRIRDFTKACEAEEYMDTGEASELLEYVHQELAKLLGLAWNPETKKYRRAT